MRDHGKNKSFISCFIYMCHVWFSIFLTEWRETEKKNSACEWGEWERDFQCFQFSNIMKRVLLYVRLLLPRWMLLMLVVCDDNVEAVNFINHLSCSFLSFTPCATSLHFRSPNKILCSIEGKMRKMKEKNVS